MRSCAELLHLFCVARVVLLCLLSCVPFFSLHLAMANNSETDSIGCVWKCRRSKKYPRPRPSSSTNFPPRSIKNNPRCMASYQPCSSSKTFVLDIINHTMFRIPCRCPPPSVPITPSSTLVSHFLSAVVVIIAPKGLKLDTTRHRITPSIALDSWVVDLSTDQHLHGG